ncbi:C69 family dipeptidase [Fructilactobacillus fructivorans]|uniref:C69 family dipeptidase n=1 Tax=Fructilactobacillus fructivorans TaxID=1614 RepID=UPI000704ABA3|nr:C69 family dipeptidase [Fructilactobacillus fructivorans]KRN43496.1 peptidase U34 dipeptidase [Fructilactobacillus fructivorans]
MIHFNEYSACTSILVGKNATVDGSTLIGRNEDAKASWPKCFVVHEHHEYRDNQEFKSTDNGFKMPLPKVRGKYTATPEWTDKEGLFEEDGINEYGVAMSATESTYANPRVLGYDPLVKNGIGEEAMVTVVLPYVHSAREAVSRLGNIIEKYGASENNGVLFSDKDEVWYLEIGSGHQWVAERIPDDHYAVVANQMAIEEVDFNNDDYFMWSPQIYDFVSSNRLNPDRSGFNFRHIFGTHDLSDTYYNTPRVWYGQRMFNPAVKQDPTSQNMPFTRKSETLISELDAQNLLSSHYQGTQFDPLGAGDEADRTKFRPVSLAKTQESHVLQIKPNLPIEIGGIHWLAMGVAAQSTYVPFLEGITDTPEAYKYHIKRDFDPKSAYWIFKLVGILVDPHYLEFGDKLKEVQQTLIEQYEQILKQTDTEASGLNSSELSQLANEASTKSAKLAMRSFKNLGQDLITNSTDFSPLNYHQDLNL